MSRADRVALAGFAAAVVTACNFGFYQGQDRPEDPNVAGPPPPADFHCERGERRIEHAEKGGHGDRVVHVLGTGEVICSTEDRNGDGKIDTWDLVEHGRVVEQASDTDFNGTLDRRVRVAGSDGGAVELVAPLGPHPYAPIRD